jgi:chaperonin GroES
MADIKIQPIGGYILVKPTEKEEQKTASGLIIQSSGNEKPQKGVIVALGTGMRDETGKLVPWNVKVNDAVLFKKYSPEEIKWNNEEYLIMKESDVLAVINE